MKKLGPRRLLSLLFPVGKIVVFASLNHLRTLCSRLLAHPVLLPKHPPIANHIVLFFPFQTPFELISVQIQCLHNETGRGHNLERKRTQRKTEIAQDIVIIVEQFYLQ